MKALIVVLLVFGMAVTTQASVILAWDMSGQTGTQVSQVANVIDSNLDTSAGYNTLTRVGLTPAAAGNSFNSSAWNTTATFTEGNKYLSFTLAPAPGYWITITSLQSTHNGSNTAPNTGRWGYRIGTGSWVYESDWTVTFAIATRTWDFADVSNIVDPIEFRFWMYGTTSIAGGTSTATGTGRIANVAGNDLILNGSVTVIPEPGVFVLMAIGGLAILRFARRRSV